MSFNAATVVPRNQPADVVVGGFDHRRLARARSARSWPAACRGVSRVRYERWARFDIAGRTWDRDARKGATARPAVLFMQSALDRIGA